MSIYNTLLSEEGINLSLQKHVRGVFGLVSVRGSESFGLKILATRAVVLGRWTCFGFLA